MNIAVKIDPNYIPPMIPILDGLYVGMKADDGMVFSCKVSYSIYSNKELLSKRLQDELPPGYVLVND